MAAQGYLLHLAIHRTRYFANDIGQSQSSFKDELAEVQRLLEAGADANELDNTYMTPLGYCVAGYYDKNLMLSNPSTYKYFLPRPLCMSSTHFSF